MLIWKFCLEYEKIWFFFRKFYILWTTTQKSTLRSQNDENVILLITFYVFLGIFYAFLKILHKIWKNPIFLPQISYFMTYHSKIHNKVSKIKNKLYKPIFCPFWTPVTIWKLKNPPTKILVFDIKWLVNDHWKVPQCLFAWLWQNIF